MILLSIPPGTATAVIFYICAVLSIAGAIGLIAFRKPVYSALCLALVMVSLAVIYAGLGAPFLFAVQIIVYTGAVLMLFLFVIMLVGVSSQDRLGETLKGHRVAVAIAGVGVLILLTLAVAQGIHGAPVGVTKVNTDDGGNVQGLASLIFSQYVIAFEATAALLITAAVAAMVLAHPEQVKKKAGQVERAAQRLEAFITSGDNPAPRPNSGVFARHNSISTPALLPNGTVAEQSVSKVLVDRVGLATPEALWAPHDDVLDAIESAGDEPLVFDDADAGDETEPTSTTNAETITAQPDQPAGPEQPGGSDQVPTPDQPAQPELPVQSDQAPTPDAEDQSAQDPKSGQEKTND
ncbi:MAG: NADH-quinone oxidoreductase subunit J [Propionibacteriaceae bacterium]|nr:NADH-quinone oxidoreductase subunit J [Propionibacteriaceae bacterium]